MIANKVKYVAEAANMPTTLEATNLLLKNNVLIGPAKAVNAGGVAVSGLEMSQNSMRMAWTQEQVDEKLKNIMKNIFTTCYTTAEEYNAKGNLIIGANIAGFVKVANAMMAQGLV
ncbi:NADP-specific glutamate dehydrogenase [subsurface metagenome]